MINWKETLHYYVELIRISDNHFTHDLILWYQEQCRFYFDEVENG
jgi:hypothetical protein